MGSKKEWDRTEQLKTTRKFVPRGPSWVTVSEN